MTEEEANEAISVLGAGDQLRLSVGSGHRCVVMLTNYSGIHTGKPTYLVACVECDELLHARTTGPVWHIRSHDARTTMSTIAAGGEAAR